eukprot:gnl/TRDRNA2_/TRDRNA2_174477_c1_seq12.p1 gnl/TRDRNA2_/TRDRNA2_174477_c1~~gnl/TRDRNA2_/TRDRNA2_174477_c1_seq12.p1  ORF type:complete len:513 (-),score=38.63 gnl/TRDRNA2_/TRDRNA2_174477_c1_seq12:75-1583(-)
MWSPQAEETSPSNDLEVPCSPHESPNTLRDGEEKAEVRGSPHETPLVTPYFYSSRASTPKLKHRTSLRSTESDRSSLSSPRGSISKLQHETSLLSLESSRSSPPGTPIQPQMPPLVLPLSIRHHFNCDRYDFHMARSARCSLVPPTTVSSGAVTPLSDNDDITSPQLVSPSLSTSVAVSARSLYNEIASLLQPQAVAENRPTSKESRSGASISRTPRGECALGRDPAADEGLHRSASRESRGRVVNRQDKRKISLPAIQRLPKGRSGQASQAPISSTAPTTARSSQELAPGLQMLYGQTATTRCMSWADATCASSRSTRSSAPLSTVPRPVLHEFESESRSWLRRQLEARKYQSTDAEPPGAEAPDSPPPAGVGGSQRARERNCCPSPRGPSPARRSTGHQRCSSQEKEPTEASRTSETRAVPASCAVGAACRDGLARGSYPVTASLMPSAPPMAAVDVMQSVPPIDALELAGVIYRPPRSSTTGEASLHRASASAGQGVRL